MVERRSPKPDVEGSSPSGREFNFKIRNSKMNQIIDGIKSYFKGVKTEWGKVSLPEKRQVVFETLSVIFIVFVFTVAIYVLDLIFKGLLSLIK